MIDPKSRDAWAVAKRAAQGRRERRYWLKYRRDRGRRDATVRNRSPTTPRAPCHGRASRRAGIGSQLSQAASLCHYARMAGTEGERRVVAVLMADIAGSTAIGEALGPERSKYLFDEVMRLVAAEVERYDGTVAQLAGDGLLAVFGAPVAHEDDSERAVRAGLAIQRALERYGADVREAYEIDIRARIAVNTGPVVIAPGDGDARGRYNALGDTVNVTARLQALAAEGEVLLGPQTAVQVRSSFELEELGPTSLRGRAEPIDRYRVLGEIEPGPTAQEGALVGRDAELAEVREALDRLADGIGAILAITGEAGIGKSRLVAEAAAPLGDRLLVLEGRGLS